VAELGLVRQNAYLAFRRFELAILEGDSARAETRAREACEAALAIGELGNFMTFSCNLALALIQLGRDDEADQWLERGRATAPSDETVPQMLCRQAKAKILARRGEHVEAEELAREAVAMGSGGDALNLQGDALANLAEVLLVTGKPGEAAAALEQALDRYAQKGNLVSAQRVRARLEGLRRPAPP
jgi:tetratricopeptide (TPR) repeat protein